MKKYLTILTFIFTLSTNADLLRYEKEYLKYSVPFEFLRQVSPNKDFALYTPDQKESPRLVVQLFRHRKWAQWHMKGLYRAKHTFQKYFDKAFGGPDGNTLLDIAYDDKKYILALTWQRHDQSIFLSRMQLTSFGCVAFHLECSEETLEEAKVTIDNTQQSLIIPDSLVFIPEDITSEIVDNMGNTVYFIFLSLGYLAFSMRTRGKMRRRRQGRRR